MPTSLLAWPRHATTCPAPQPAAPTADGAEEEVVELPPILCTDFKGHMHVPLWITPALFAFVFVACLLGCFNKRRELVHSVGTPTQHGAKPLRNPKGTRVVDL